MSSSLPVTQYYKAVDVRGLDFRTGSVQWIPAGGLPAEGHLVVHSLDGKRLVPGKAETYLSVATVPTDCTGMEWPCRLLVVEAAGREVRRDPDLRHKRCSTRWRVVGELPAHEALGPQGTEVAAIIERASRLTGDEINRLAAARYAARYVARAAARYAARDVARGAARYAAWDAARYAAWDAAWDAALGTLTRDLITPEQHDLLMGPWREVVGR